VAPRCPCNTLGLEHLRLYGWRLFAEATAVKACGHRQEYVLLPTRDGVTAQLVPILGEAA
jgi:hypothetical protein